MTQTSGVRSGVLEIGHNGYPLFRYIASYRLRKVRQRARDVMKKEVAGAHIPMYVADELEVVQDYEFVSTLAV